MNLQVLPYKIAFALSMIAFGIVWIVGISSNVTGETLALRGLLAGAGFWALGLMMGRVFVNGVSEALSEHLEESDGKKASDRKE